MNYLLTDYAAHCDGSLWTRALQAAVDACAAQGGGVVVVPPGTYLSGGVELRSHVTLEITEGAVLQGSPDLSDYPVVPFVHNEFKEVRSLLWAIGQRDIRLRGAGVIDFNHPAFMEMDQPDLRDRDAANYPLYNERQRSEMTVVAKARPSQPIFLHDCERVGVEDLLLRQSPCWTLTLSASREVIITGCVFRCADDCVAVGSITEWDRPSENVVISNCTMISRSVAVRIGHLASKVQNVVCSNLVISDTNRGLLICAGDGGWVRNIMASNIVLHTHLFAGFWWGKGEPLAIMAAGSGRIESVSVSQVRGESEGGLVIAGPAGSIRDVALDHWTLRLSAGGNRPLMGGWIDLQPAPCPVLEQGRIPWLYADGVQQLQLRNVWATLNKKDASRYSIAPIVQNSSEVEGVVLSTTPSLHSSSAPFPPLPPR